MPSSSYRASTGSLLPAWTRRFVSGTWTQEKKSGASAAILLGCRRQPCRPTADSPYPAATTVRSDCGECRQLRIENSHFSVGTSSRRYFIAVNTGALFLGHRLLQAVALDPCPEANVARSHRPDADVVDGLGARCKAQQRVEDQLLTFHPVTAIPRSLGAPQFQLIGQRTD